VIENLTAAGTTVLLTTPYLEEAAHLARRVIVLSGGRIAADAPPAQLRAGGLTTIRYQLPAAAPAGDLPAGLAGHVDSDRGELLVRSADVTAVLDALIGWARRVGWHLRPGPSR
jgi:ABC-2 type transport system ATP-binding protein